jgi:phage-related protein
MRGQVRPQAAIDAVSQKRNTLLKGEGNAPRPKPLEWVGSSKDDLARFPGAVKRECGYALYLAQLGMRALNVKALKGFGGASVLEIIVPHQGDTYRAVFTVAFAKAVFVLHAFQKKSKRGVATPRREVELIRRRLAAASQAYRDLYGEE